MYYYLYLDIRCVKKKIYDETSCSGVADVIFLWIYIHNCWKHVKTVSSSWISISLDTRWWWLNVSRLFVAVQWCDKCGPWPSKYLNPCNKLLLFQCPIDGSVARLRCDGTRQRAQIVGSGPVHSDRREVMMMMMMTFTIYRQIMLWICTRFRG